jgi:ACS family hexuronate transporter-like MFS transporter
MINAGTAVGAVIAPPAIAAIIQYLGWRWVFFLCGAAGLLWSIWWMRDYFAPGLHPKLTAEEKSEIEEVFAPLSQQKTGESWFKLFAFPEVCGLVLGKFLSDAAWYFYLFWLPKYLYDARGFDTKKVGYYAWIPYAAAGLGSLLGGWCSSQLLRRGNSLNYSRKIGLGASAAVMPLIVFVTQVPVEWAIVLFSVAFFGQQSWSTLVMILPTDLFPRRVVGSVAGLVGFGGAMGGVVFNLIVGRMLDGGYGYGPVFAIVSTLHVAAFILILLTIREVRPLEFKGAAHVGADVPLKQ